jgi:hypothetical protein
MSAIVAPRIFCDFNGGVSEDCYGLASMGTTRDLERLGVRLEPGLQVIVYDYDAFESGEPAWIVADAVIVADSRGDLVARVDPASFRWEPRSEPG